MKESFVWSNLAFFYVSHVERHSLLQSAGGKEEWLPGNPAANQIV